MKHILWLSHETDLGGANKCLLEYLQVLHGHGYRITLLVPGKGAFSEAAAEFVEDIHEVYGYQWIRDTRLPARPLILLKRMWRNVGAVLRLLRIVRRVKPDYVATNTVTMPTAAVAAKIGFRKHVWFIHEFGEEDHGYRIFCGFSRGARLINWLSEKVVFNSEAIGKKYEAFVPRQKRFLAHNPVLIEETYLAPLHRQASTTEVLHAVILGQIAPSKNQMEALQAIEQLKQKGHQIRLTLAGHVVDEAYSTQLKQYVQDASLQDQVIFAGYLDNPFLLLQRADLYIMCSRNEAFGRVSVEALKMGVPVIAADSGGSPEIVEEGRNGYLYPAGNSEALVATLERFISNRHQFSTAQIAEAARKKYNEIHTLEQLRLIFA